MSEHEGQHVFTLKILAPNTDSIGTFKNDIKSLTLGVTYFNTLRSEQNVHHFAVWRYVQMRFIDRKFANFDYWV